MYRITELADGGLVVCGNSSHNGDDSYLAKLYPDCQSRADYSFFTSEYPFDNANAFQENDFVHTVNGIETWDTDMNVFGITRVAAGSTLTINNGAVIGFADSHQLSYPTRIEVEPGGKLFLADGARLTSIANCPNSMWDGILVKGSSESQDGNNYADQGLADISRSTIENARTAIITNSQFLDNDDLAAFQMQFAGGGVVKARQASFHNNKRDVVMGPYENHRPGDPTEIRVNRSSFVECDFAVNAALNDRQRPLEHMLLFGVRNVPVHGCSFSGTYYQPDQNSPLTTDAGIGIRSVNSSFTVQPHCTVVIPYGGTCPTANTVPSTFDRLTLGVEVAGLTDDKTFSVDKSSFTRCPRSIRMDAVRDAAITSNHIDVVDWRHPFAASTPYGVYSDECTGYEIEDNVLTMTTTTDQAQAGMVIRNSGPEANRVYNNSFDGFAYKNSTALLVQGKNADAGNNYLTGLEVKCNEFGRYTAKNAFDVALTATDPTVRKNQGAIFNDPGDFTAPAGNLFSDHTSADDPESDWHVANTSPLQVRYFHHNGSNSDPWVPEFYDATYLLPQPAGGNWPPNRSQACPSNQRSRDRERSAMESSSGDKATLLQDSKDAYDATKDNGDTYTLLGYVSDPAHTSTQVRNALQSVAPKVSVEVWEAAFARDPFPNEWNLTQALLSNSPLQPEVMKLCYYSALSDFYYNLVVSAQNGINPLDILESDISTYAGGKAEDLTDLGRWSWLDSTNVDSAITLLKTWHDQLPADNGAAVQLGYYNAKGNMAALYTLAQTMELNSALPDVYALLKRYAVEQENTGWLSPSADTKGWMENLVQDRETLGSARAGTWLQALGADPLEEVIVLPEQQQKRMEAPARVRHSTSNEALILEAYPNPTEGLAYVVCNVPDGVEQATVVVRDLEGREQVRSRISSGTAVVELDMTHMSSGLYVANLTLDGVQAGQVKISVQ